MPQRWDAARAASRRSIRAYKPVGPVGTQPMIDWGGARVDSTHECCGYHVCSCERQGCAPTCIDALDAKIKALMGLMPYASYELLAAALDEDKT